MDLNTLSQYPTSAEIEIARGYLIAFVDQLDPHAETLIPKIKHWPAEKVVEQAIRCWPEGWNDFREKFASDIRAAEAEERARWHAEAEQAARKHVFAARMPAAALAWGQCSLTATEAVHDLGLDIGRKWCGDDVPVLLAALYAAEGVIRRVQGPWRDGMSWREIADILAVPIPIAIAWAIESRIRRIR